MENNLKNRYIYAVTRHLPAKIATDVEQELDSLITEMVDERTGDIPRPIGQQYPPTTQAPSEQVMKDVLAELGSPDELALKYYGGERKALISGVYYLMYKRVLRIALPILAVVLAVLTTINVVLGDEYSRSLVLGFLNMTFTVHIVEIIVVTIGGVVQAFAAITIIFAVMDYMKVDLKDGDFFDLPQIPESRLKISPLGPIGNIVLSVSLTALLLGFPQVIRLYQDFTWIPIFDTAAMRGLWLPILLWCVVEIGIEIYKLIEGQYTIRLSMVTIVTSALQVIFAIAVFGSSSILSTEFVSLMEGLGVSYWPNIFYTVIARPNMVLLAIVLVALAIEVIDVVVKTFNIKRVSGF